MRVLAMVNGFPTAQAPHDGIFILKQLQALAERGHEFRVIRIVPIAPDVGKWKRYARLPDRCMHGSIDVRVLRTLFPPGLRLLDVPRAFVSAALRREIAAFCPDLIHAHTALFSGYFALNRGLPVVLTAHGGDVYATPYRRRGLLQAATQAVSGADVVVGVSAFIRRALLALGRSDTHVVFNGADDRLFFPRPRSHARMRLDIPQERFVVAIVGRITREKGVYDLAQALENIADLRPFLLLAGCGPERMTLARRLRAAGIEHRFLGALEHAETAHVYAAADVVTLPSHEEGLPAVLCEAMLSGRAVTAAAVGGIPEVIRHEESGLLIPPHDAFALARALRAIAKNPARKQRYESAARAFALTHLTWRRNAREYEHLYAQAAQRFTRPAARSFTRP